MSKRHSNKDINNLIKELVAVGWEIIGSKRHFKLRSPGGGLVSMSSSPSDEFAVNQIKRDVRRVQKEEGHEQIS